MNSHDTYSFSNSMDEQPVIVAEGVIEGFGTWSLDSEGCLYIEGHGDMPDWTETFIQPWDNMRKEIRSVYIAHGATSIGNWSFECCTAMLKIVIPDSVSKIGTGACRDCWALQELSIPDSVIRIGSEAFNSCALQEIIIPSSVIELGSWVFAFCWALRKITIPDSVRKIGNMAFAYCKKLESLTIPGRFDCPDFERRYGCQRKYVTFTGFSTIAEGVINDSISWRLNDGGYLYLEGVGKMPDYPSFWSLDEPYVGAPWYDLRDRVRYVYLSDGISSIGDHAFIYCALQHIELPDSICAIGAGAFEGCSSLRSIDLSDDITSIGDGVFFLSGLQRIRMPGRFDRPDFEEYYGCSPDIVTFF